jgi:hypothetical protein
MAKAETAKQRVLTKWPNAYATKGFGFYAGMWVIKDLVIRSNIYSNHCHTASGAWSAAAKELK